MLGPGIALKHDPACLLPRPRRIADVAFRICGSKNVPKVFKARNGSGDLDRLLRRSLVAITVGGLAIGGAARVAG